MSLGELRWSEEERAIWEYRQLQRQLAVLLHQIQSRLTAYDEDLARELQRLEQESSRVRAQRITSTLAQQGRKALRNQLQRARQIQRELERRRLLRAQRLQELQGLEARLRQQWQRIRTRFHHYQKQAEEIWARLQDLWESLPQQDLARDEIYREYRQRMHSVLQQWDDLLIQEARAEIQQELGSMDIGSTWELPNSTQASMPGLDIPRPTFSSPDKGYQTIRQRLAALRPFLTFEEVRRLESLTSAEALEEALLDMEIRLQTLQADAHALLNTYRDSVLLQPWLKPLDKALHQQDWGKLRYLVPQIQQLLQDPSWTEALTLEAFFRQYLPDYDIQWEHPGEVMLVEGDGTQARVRLDPRNHTAYVEPERETPQFCHRMEDLARRVGLTWLPQDRRGRTQMRTLPPRR